MTLPQVLALVRLALRVDRRLALACLGLAAAIMVPVAGVLATATLAPTVDASQGSLVHSTTPNGLDLDRLPQPGWALAGTDIGARHVVAFVEGPSLVGARQAYDGGPAGRTLDILGTKLTTVSLGRNVVGPGMTLVHPSVLGVAPVEAAFFPNRAPEAGTVFLPARGADAFELVGIAELQEGTGALAAISIPLVLLVAASFARLEARSLANVVAVVAALGRPERAGQVLILRILLVCGAGAALCLAGLVVAMQSGLMPFGWSTLASRSLAIAVALPTAAAAVAGSAVAWVATTRTRATLRTKPALGDEGRLGFLPVRARPMLTGWRLLGVFCLVGLVVALDVGLPIAASGVPAALAGDEGEWVVGATSSSLTAGRAQEAPAKVLAMDPAVQRIVAETFIPTAVQGQPVLLRGGDWAGMSTYHDLTLLRGHAPGPGEIALGTRSGDRLDATLGDRLLVPGVNGILGHLRVSGLYATPSLLADEGVLHPEDARRLAELPAGTVHVLRMQPDSKAAREALERDTPLLVFDTLTVTPAEAPTGTVAVAALRATNLGGAPGTRVANLLVGNVSVATQVVQLAAYGQTVVELPFVVPRGAYQLKVNPEAFGQGEDAAWVLRGPESGVVGSNLTFQVLREGRPQAGIQIGLHADLATAAEGASILATGLSDAEGRVVLSVPRPGLMAVAARDETTLASFSVYGVAAANRTVSRFVVEAAFVEPGTPVVGQPAILSARVRNVGGVAGTERVEFEADGLRVGVQDVAIGPGQSRTVTVEYSPRSAAAVLEANGVRVTGAASARAAGATVTAGEVRAGAALQQDVADRLLGNAGAVLGGLAVTTAAAAFVVLVLATQRTMSQRRGIAAVLATVWTPEQIRRRAATEGAILGGIAGIVGVAGAKLFIGTLGTLTAVRAFGHALPDPYTPLFLGQVAAATAFLGGLAMYNAIGRRVEGGTNALLRASGGEIGKTP